jgi:hypothetical protein
VLGVAGGVEVGNEVWLGVGVAVGVLDAGVGDGLGDTLGVLVLGDGLRCGRCVAGGDECPPGVLTSVGDRNG